ncbi:MAG TPA: hypothetical protein VKT22_07295 [Steroidobacteraceae bacterium]|nr:hypothetical protein [Steroidobacteraceae bacterium]
MQPALIGPWTRQPHFSLEALAPLHDLNQRFLDLLAERGAGWPMREHATQSASVGRALASLTPAQRVQAARCPYALFDLHFHDEAHWRGRLERACVWRVEDAAPVDGELGEFVHLALFYAWHVAASARLSPQVLLGMHAGTARAFRAATLNALPALALSEALRLEPRWSAHGSFWGTLIRAASRSDEARLRRVQLFGLQLAAAARLP